MQPIHTPIVCNPYLCPSDEAEREITKNSPEDTSPSDSISLHLDVCPKIDEREREILHAPPYLDQFNSNWSDLVKRNEKRPYLHFEQQFAQIKKELEKQPALAAETFAPLFMCRMNSNGGDLMVVDIACKNSPFYQSAKSWKDLLEFYLRRTTNDGKLSRRNAIAEIYLQFLIRVGSNHELQHELIKEMSEWKLTSVKFKSDLIITRARVLSATPEEELKNNADKYIKILEDFKPSSLEDIQLLRKGINNFIMANPTTYLVKSLGLLSQTFNEEIENIATSGVNNILSEKQLEVFNKVFDSRKDDETIELIAQTINNLSNTVQQGILLYCLPNKDLYKGYFVLLCKMWKILQESPIEKAIYSEKLILSALCHLFNKQDTVETEEVNAIMKFQTEIKGEFLNAYAGEFPRICDKTIKKQVKTKTKSVDNNVRLFQEAIKKRIGDINKGFPDKNNDNTLYHLALQLILANIMPIVNIEEEYKNKNGSQLTIINTKKRLLHTFHENKSIIDNINRKKKPFCSYASYFLSRETEMLDEEIDKLTNNGKEKIDKSKYLEAIFKIHGDLETKDESIEQVLEKLSSYLNPNEKFCVCNDVLIDNLFKLVWLYSLEGNKHNINKLKAAQIIYALACQRDGYLDSTLRILLDQICKLDFKHPPVATLYLIASLAEIYPKNQVNGIFASDIQVVKSVSEIPFSPWSKATGVRIGLVLELISRVNKKEPSERTSEEIFLHGMLHKPVSIFKVINRLILYRVKDIGFGGVARLINKLSEDNPNVLQDLLYSLFALAWQKNDNENDKKKSTCELIKFLSKLDPKVWDAIPFSSQDFGINSIIEEAVKNLVDLIDRKLIDQTWVKALDNNNIKEHRLSVCKRTYWGTISKNRPFKQLANHTSKDLKILSAFGYPAGIMYSFCTDNSSSDSKNIPQDLVELERFFPEETAYLKDLIPRKKDNDEVLKNVCQKLLTHKSNIQTSIQKLNLKLKGSQEHTNSKNSLDVYTIERVREMLHKKIKDTYRANVLELKYKAYISLDEIKMPIKCVSIKQISTSERKIESVIKELDADIDNMKKARSAQIKQLEMEVNELFIYQEQVREIDQINFAALQQKKSEYQELEDAIKNSNKTVNLNFQSLLKSYVNQSPETKSDCQKNFNELIKNQARLQIPPNWQQSNNDSNRLKQEVQQLREQLIAYQNEEKSLRKENRLLNDELNSNKKSQSGNSNKKLSVDQQIKGDREFGKNLIDSIKGLDETLTLLSGKNNAKPQNNALQKLLAITDSSESTNEKVGSLLINLGFSLESTKGDHYNYRYFDNKNKVPGTAITLTKDIRSPKAFRDVLLAVKKALAFQLKQRLYEKTGDKYSESGDSR